MMTTDFVLILSPTTTGLRLNIVADENVAYVLSDNNIAGDDKFLLFGTRKAIVDKQSEKRKTENVKTQKRKNAKMQKRKKRKKTQKTQKRKKRKNVKMQLCKTQKYNTDSEK